MQIYECSIRGEKTSPNKMVTTLVIEGALSQDLAKELGGDQLYMKNGVLINFTDHGFDHDIQAANVTFFPLPGSPGENNALLHLNNVVVKNFYATKLDGAGAKVEFQVVADGLNVPIAEFLRDVRGWSGRIEIEELQQELPMEGGEGEAPANLPEPPNKRGRGAQPKPADEDEVSQEVLAALDTGAADVKSTKSGKVRLVPRKPGENKGARWPKGKGKPRR